MTVDNEVIEVADEPDSGPDSAEQPSERDARQETRSRGIGDRIPRFGRRDTPVLLLALITVATSALVTLYFTQYRPDRMTNDAAREAVLTAATEGTVALLSYSPDTLTKDFATAKAHLTGDFLSYYNDFTDQIVGPAARQKAVKTTAKVIEAAASSITPDSAVVLAFINQTTTSTEKPDPAISASSVKITLKRFGSSWLISSFDPV